MSRSGKNPFQDLKYYHVLRTTYKKEKPDYIFHYTIKPNIYGTLAASMCKICSSAMIAGLGYPFPEIEGEKFCPEALVWNRIALKYKLRYFYEKIYLCNYLEDGLTAKITRIRMNSPVASCMYYAELYYKNIPFLQKLKAAINYWRFAFCSEFSFRQAIKELDSIALCLVPCGYLYHLKDVYL